MILNLTPSWVQCNEQPKIVPGAPEHVVAGVEGADGDVGGGVVPPTLHQGELEEKKMKKNYQKYLNTQLSFNIYPVTVPRVTCRRSTVIWCAGL